MRRQKSSPRQPPGSPAAAAERAGRAAGSAAASVVTDALNAEGTGDAWDAPAAAGGSASPAPGPAPVLDDAFWARLASAVSDPLGAYGLVSEPDHFRRGFAEAAVFAAGNPDGAPPWERIVLSPGAAGRSGAAAPEPSVSGSALRGRGRGRGAAESEVTSGVSLRRAAGLDGETLQSIIAVRASLQFASLSMRDNLSPPAAALSPHLSCRAAQTPAPHQAARGAPGAMTAERLEATKLLLQLEKIQQGDLHLVRMHGSGRFSASRPRSRASFALSHPPLMVVSGVPRLSFARLLAGGEAGGDRGAQGGQRHRSLHQRPEGREDAGGGRGAGEGGGRGQLLVRLRCAPARRVLCLWPPTQSAGFRDLMPLHKCAKDPSLTRAVRADRSPQASCSPLDFSRRAARGFPGLRSTASSSGNQCA